MKIKKLTLGAMAANCYIVKKNNQVVIVDPGDNPEIIIDNVNKEEVLAILLTHGHFDHIGALNSVAKVFKCPVFASKQEETLLNNPSMSFYDEKITADITYIDSSFTIGDFNIILHHTPGHTQGSVMYQIENHLFTGDTLFDEAIGRIDLPSGSILEMRKSLQYIKQLDPMLIIYPGHNQISSLKKQLKFNPYLNR